MNDVPDTVGAFFDMRDGHTMPGNLLADFVGGAHAVHQRRAVCVKYGYVHVLVVHHQQAFFGAGTTLANINREKVHAVVMRTYLLLLVGAGIGAVSPVVRIAAGQRSAPGGERRHTVALRHEDSVFT